VRRLQRGVSSIEFAGSGPCALTTDGVLCLSGGSERENGLWTPLRIGGLPNELGRLWMGDAAQCAQSPSGELWCWNLAAGAAAKQVTQLGTETQEVVMGQKHVCAKTRRGSVFCWGDNTVGQLGLGDQSPHDTPTEIVELGSAVRKLVAGTNHTCALLSSGTVSCWGKSEYGTLGSATTMMFAKPTSLPALGASVIGLYAAQNQLCAQSQDGSLSCLGTVFLDNEHSTTRTPMKVVGLPVELSALTIGPTDACAVTRSGELWCWGALLRRNYTGTAILTVSGAQHAAGLHDVATVSIDAYSACALTRSGNVYCWGDGGNGQLGTGNLTHSVRPVRVAIPCSQ
jgi:alpha-tubulin suppressor-like RCC1 family protein